MWGRFSVQVQSNSRRWLHRTEPRKRHQMRHLVDGPCFLQSRCSLRLKDFAGNRARSRDHQFKAGLRDFEFSASTHIQSPSANPDVSGRSKAHEGEANLPLIRTIHEQLMVRNIQYSSMPLRRLANIQSNPLIAVTSAATSIARGQPHLVATNAVTIGASQPPKLPKVFIKEDTEAL